MLGLNWKMSVGPLVFALCLSTSGSLPAQWGDLEGSFVLDGDAPKLDPVVKKGDASAKDAAVCAAEGVPNEKLVVNPENKGIAHIFVFLRKADKVHPDLKTSKEKEAVFDQKGCLFLPHALIVRNDQVVMVKSDDGISHNTHTFPLKNSGVNFVVQPSDRKGQPVKVPLAESIPFEVKCDIHPWMSARWLVLDHPYGATTDKDGKFKIEKLPVGKHSFRVWQESAGWVEREWAVEINEGENKLEPVKVPVAKFKL